MSLGNRTARNRHIHAVAGLRVEAVVSQDYWDFQPQQRVMTCDGIPGVVASVHDGPFPSTEEYFVMLDGGMGSGRYTTGQLSAIGGGVEVHAGERHLASDDYPEMGSILHDRPDIGVYGRPGMPLTASLAARVTGSTGDQCEGCGRTDAEAQRNILGQKGCAECGGTRPYEVASRDGVVYLDRKPMNVNGKGAYANSIVQPDGNGGHTAFLTPGYNADDRTYRGAGSTPTKAAQDAVANWAQGEGKHWEHRPATWHTKLNKNSESSGW